MDYTIVCFEVQEPSVNVSGSRRYASTQKYSLDVGPKTSLIQLQITCIWLYQQSVQGWNLTAPTATQGKSPWSKETASAKAMVRTQRSTSVLNFLSCFGHWSGLWRKRSLQLCKMWLHHKIVQVLQEPLTSGITSNLAITPPILMNLTKASYMMRGTRQRSQQELTFAEVIACLWTSNPTQEPSVIMQDTGRRISKLSHWSRKGLENKQAAGDEAYSKGAYPVRATLLTRSCMIKCLAHLWGHALGAGEGKMQQREE